MHVWTPGRWLNAQRLSIGPVFVEHCGLVWAVHFTEGVKKTNNIEVKKDQLSVIEATCTAPPT